MSPFILKVWIRVKLLLVTAQIFLAVKDYFLIDQKVILC